MWILYYSIEQFAAYFRLSFYYDSLDNLVIYHVLVFCCPYVLSLVICLANI